MKLKWIPVGALLCLVIVGAAFTPTAPSAYAQKPSPDVINHMERIAQGLYCPVCAGVPLNVCETQACEQWRNLIVEKLQQGQTDEQIRQYFIDQYGERVLGAPPPQGFNLGAYILPLLILLGGAAILFFTLRGWLHTRNGPTPQGVPATIPPIAPEYAERIARELRERE
jgi:cytochrome c-type biogenesis protein CcmH